MKVALGLPDATKKPPPALMVARFTGAFHNFFTMTLYMQTITQSAFAYMVPLQGELLQSVDFKGGKPLSNMT